MTLESSRPRLLIVAGPNGAGKTTVTEQGLAHTWFQGCEYINPDLIARDEFVVAKRAVQTAKFSGVKRVAELNTTARNEAPSFVSADGCRLYFTSTLPPQSAVMVSDVLVASKPK